MWSNIKVLPAMEEIKIIEYDKFTDIRGDIYSILSKEISQKIGLDFDHVKIVKNKYNVLRGIHFDQKTHKLINVLSGSIQAFFVDVASYKNGKARFAELKISSDSNFSVLIPPGVGNSFLCLSKEVIYCYSLAYAGDYADVDEQETIFWNDEILNLPWVSDNPVLSDRDSS